MIFLLLPRSQDSRSRYFWWCFFLLWLIMTKYPNYPNIKCIYIPDAFNIFSPKNVYLYTRQLCPLPVRVFVCQYKFLLLLLEKINKYSIYSFHNQFYYLSRYQTILTEQHTHTGTTKN